MATDYYSTLNLPRTASQNEVKQAYRRLAREFHPDVRRDDAHAEDRFKEINEAYYVLGDPDRRAQYDRFGRVGDIPQDPRDLFSSFDDLFGMFFGTRGGAVRTRDDEPLRGSDLLASLEITLEDAAGGVEKTITLQRLETCATCFGTGREPGSTPETCPTCRGSGQMRMQQQTVFGYFTQVTTCRQCGGRGTVVRRPCTECGGDGRRATEREVVVKVPAGVETGMRLRLPDEGEGGVRGGERGDLFVAITVRPHPIFRREGADLFSETPISMLQAALGDEITIGTLDEQITTAIPPGTQPGSRLRLRGKGMPTLRGGRGDLFVRLKVEIPMNLTAEQRKALLQLAELRGESVRPQQKSLWKKMKDLVQ